MMKGIYPLKNQCPALTSSTERQTERARWSRLLWRHHDQTVPKVLPELLFAEIRSVNSHRKADQPLAEQRHKRYSLGKLLWYAQAGYNILLSDRRRSENHSSFTVDGDRVGSDLAGAPKFPPHNLLNFRSGVIHPPPNPTRKKPRKNREETAYFLAS